MNTRLSQPATAPVIDRATAYKLLGRFGLAQPKPASWSEFKPVAGKQEQAKEKK